MDYKGALAPPARPSQPPITPSSASLILELICNNSAVGLMQHEAKGSVLHSRNVAELRGQDNTCAAGMTRYCNILRRTNGTLQKLWQEVVPPRKDGTIPTEADCEKLNEQEKKDQAGDLKQKWKLSGCCDATKFDKSDQKQYDNILITQSSWRSGCGIS
ncbi:hypothetical protein PSTT_01611 [Puccinia striiformis]|uniref:Uncharacterized protein n=2 Tax=Puccinia striiformis TaxID=27350 RepID=A0A0L0VG83_9BASI|nr:hypothetical protein PSTG_08386 [Puccinia striiformis f. sp. tritici PST-78]POW16100.1 hypothetical protein PSTT_01611 [Puccinia striiformis]